MYWVPRDFLREALVLRHFVRGWLPRFLSFPHWILILKHPIWEHLWKFFLKKLVCQEVFDSNTMCLSYAVVFQHNTSYPWHGYIFHSMVGILKVECEVFCQRDVSFHAGFLLLINRAGKTSWIQQSKCLELWIQMTKIYFVNIITGFLNVWNQLEELRRVTYPEILAKIFPQLRPWWEIGQHLSW